MTNFRVRIVQDEPAEEPYDDGSSPLLRITTSRNGYGAVSAEQVQRTSYVVPANIIEAAERWANRPDAFERYLRAFHGTRSVVWYDERDGGAYVTFDSADWRAAVGAEGESLANLDEWRAYCEGDVYGFVIQEETTWSNETGAEMTTWEHVDSCWGFYGYQWAEEAGAEALSNFTATV